MRPCLNGLQKQYCLKTKVIVLDWQWVTQRLWCQINRNGQSSPVKNKVEGKQLQILGKIMIMSGKSTLFGHFFVSIFRSLVFTSVFLLIKMILLLYFTHAWLRVDLVFALLLDIWWFCFGFGSCEWKREEKKRVKLVSRDGKLFWKLIFNQFYDRLQYFFNGIQHINLVKIEDMK